MRNPIGNIDVLILCGGHGKRLRKISSKTPKPIIKINDRRFLDILIERMAGFGFRSFILAVGYKADVIRQYYKNYRLPGVKISFSEEGAPLGTGGAIKHAARTIQGDPFFVLNGDSFCEFNPLDFLRFHKNKKAMVSVLLNSVKNPGDYGNVKLDENFRIVNFAEKECSVKKSLINAGAYIFDRKIFALMPHKKAFSIERDFFPYLYLSGKKCFGYVTKGFFIDIGTPERYLKAKRCFKNTFGFLRKPQAHVKK